MHLRLTKHEGLGNDFLVLLDRGGDRPLATETIRRLCDRRRGIGADGLIRAIPAAGDAEGAGSGLPPGAGGVRGQAAAGREQGAGSELQPPVGYAREQAAAGGAEGARRPVDAVDAVMELYNADGSRAEMSGNGIRCLAQALLLEGWATSPEVSVSTDAGLRVLTVIDSPDPAPTGAGGGGEGITHVLSVDMGRAVIQPDPVPDWARQPASPIPAPVGQTGEAEGLHVGGQQGTSRAAWVTVGNPHLVIEVADPSALRTVDLIELGEKVNTEAPEGANVHLMAPGPGPSTVTIRTYERGVGLTQACGTGACASAVVAAAWDLVDPPAAGGVDGPAPVGSGAPVVTVEMPGGRAQVEVGQVIPEGPGTELPSVAGATAPAALGYPVRLIGPATAIAAVEYPWPSPER